MATYANVVRRMKYCSNRLEKDLIMSKANETAGVATAATTNQQTLAACWLLLAVVFAWLYGHTLHGLFDDWWNDPDYSHGLVVPFVAFYVLYRRSAELRRLPHVPTSRAFKRLTITLQNWCTNMAACVLLILPALPRM